MEEWRKKILRQGMKEADAPCGIMLLSFVVLLGSLYFLASQKDITIWQFIISLIP